MSRDEIQEFLETLLGSKNVYFQAPPSTGMAYPCIMYKFAKPEVRHANNKPYLKDIAYTVTVIDQDPDSTIPDLLTNLPKSGFERFYASGGLNHFVFTIFF